MLRSTQRILTTHIGSLPRPDDLRELLLARDQGGAYDDQALHRRVSEATSEVVAKQVELGLDIVADGEMGKNSFVNYVRDRLTGFDDINPTQDRPRPSPATLGRKRRRCPSTPRPGARHH